LSIPPDSGSPAIHHLARQLTPPPTLRNFGDAEAIRPGSLDGGRPQAAYWRAIVRHRWTVLSVFVLSVLAALGSSILARPVFSATALLRVDREEPRVLKFDQVVREDGELPQTQLQTFQRLLQTRTLANKVIDILKLEHHSEFEKFRNQRSELTSAFLERLQVDVVRNARLIKVWFWSHDPDLSAAAANTLVDEFMSQHLGHKVEASRSATSFLSKHQDDARRRVEAAEARVADFLKENDIQFVGVDRLHDPQALINQQLVILSDSLLKARAERIAKESALEQTRSAEKGAIPAVLQNPVIAKLKEEAAAVERKSRELGQAFKADYPRMQRLAENIAEVRAQLQEETQKIIGGITAEYQAALQNETQLQKLVDHQRSVAHKLEGQMGRYNLLRREAEASREVYTALSTRLKETQIAASLTTSNISIVDHAEIPLKPMGPGKTMKLLLGAMVGLVAGVGLALLLDHRDTSIRDPDEIEAILNVPMLGVVPARPALDARWAGALSQNGSAGKGNFALVAHDASNSPLAEAFRNVRTSVVYSAEGQLPKTVLVASLHHDDGATSISTNCAISFAQLRTGNVLVIDANMRHPSLHTFLGVPGAPGLSDVLTGGADLNDAITPAWQREGLKEGVGRRIPGLYVLPAGNVPFNPADLLASQRFADLMTTLSDRFAHIVIDAPPMFGVSEVGVSDVRVLARQVEGVILVLRHGRASRDAARNAVRMLTSAHTRVLGVVLNQVRGRLHTPTSFVPFPNGTSGLDD
jgi:capsular exopolysaccharide synthesis family protein